jgi:hypothetical protein
MAIIEIQMASHAVPIQRKTREGKNGVFYIGWGWRNSNIYSADILHLFLSRSNIFPYNRWFLKPYQNS